MSNYLANLNMTFRNNSFNAVIFKVNVFYSLMDSWNNESSVRHRAPIDYHGKMQDVFPRSSLIS